MSMRNPDDAHASIDKSLDSRCESESICSQRSEGSMNSQLSIIVLILITSIGFFNAKIVFVFAFDSETKLQLKA